MKLLIVEDEEKINNAISQGFREEGFDVSSAFDGEEARTIIERDEFDCVVLDLMLPHLDGITLLTRMREHKDNTPVIILTARDEVEDKVKGLNSGADDYLAKPFSFHELLSRVKAIIRRTSSNQTILQVDSLFLDPFKKTVTRAGVPIHITGKDFILLEYLMRNKGAAVSEDRIIRHLWDFEEEISSNVVASHIKNLRIKVDKAFPKEKPVIHTLRGLGYKLDG